MKNSTVSQLTSGRLRLFGSHPRTRGDGWHDQDANEIRFRLAVTRLELFAAFRLLQHRYHAAGLTQSRHTIRVEPFHLWPQSQVCVAVQQEEVVGCLTIVRPGPFGLPSERTHSAALRTVPTGARVAEVTSFAIGETVGRRSLSVILGLTRLVQRFGLNNGVEFLFAVVHPRHARFYERAVGFRRVGDQFPCERVEGNPGVAMLGRIDAVGACRQQWQASYAADTTSLQEDLVPRALTDAQRAFFAAFLPDDLQRRDAA